MRYLLILFFLTILPIAGNAQKAFKPIKTALKEKNYKEAVNKVNALRKDSIYTNNLKLCLYSIEAYRGLNDAENLKIYLKKDYDTLTFFSTTLQIIKEAVRLDSLERIQQKEKETKSKQTNYICELLRLYLPNIKVASRYFYKKKNYAEAMKYVQTCIDIPKTEIGKLAVLPALGDTTNACLYLMSAYYGKKIKEVHHYEQLALQDTTLRSQVIEILAYTAEEEADTATYRKWLVDGFTNYPTKNIFFTRLADLYASRADNSAILRLTEQQLKRDSLNTLALLAQCNALLKMQLFDSCISTANRLLKTDTTYVEAYYYLGASYVGNADSIVFPDNALSRNYKKAKKEKNALYRKAMNYLESYKEQMPEHKKQWAPLLYKVYLELNEGKKFSNIEKLVNN